MNFLNTLTPVQWLIFGLVPPAILALYFLKLKRQPLEVPSTYLWSRTIEDLHVNSIWQRLRHLLSLLVQVALLLLLVGALAQPAVAMAFPAALAGRALSAYNLVIFLGVFVVQWGVGLAVDAFKGFGLGEIASFQCAMAVFLLCCLASYGYFLLAKPHNHAQ